MTELKHVIDARQFTKEFLNELFASTRQIKNDTPRSLLNGKIMASVFYDPSTRTRFSFESAMLRLGGQCIGTENAGNFSSAAKGEDLRRTIINISKYCDVIALRSGKAGNAHIAALNSSVPIINAGDGADQHPTQALLDLFTLLEYFFNIHGLHIGFCGDLANSRTVRSLIYLIGKYYTGNHIHFISPKQVQMKPDILEFLKKHDIPFHIHENFTKIISDLDVLYDTRVQTERFKTIFKIIQLYFVKKAAKKLIITHQVAQRMKPRAIIMHPQPITYEISPEVDNNHRAHYYQQGENGLYIRMALLKWIFS